MQRIRNIIIILFVIVGLWFFNLKMTQSVASGVITNMVAVTDGEMPYQSTTVHVGTKDITAKIYDTTIPYKVGTRVLVEPEAGVTDGYQITDIVRTPSLVLLFGLFIVLVIIVSGMHGLRALGGLFLSFVIIFSFVLPQIIAGGQPITVVLIASLLILFVSYYLTHGFSQKTTVALTGTFVSLVVTAVLAILFGRLAHLTGFGSEEAAYLQDQFSVPLDVYNILIGGMIISTLGVLDDITIAQASIVSELREANPKLGIPDLFIRAMRVGHDHIAALLNTLVLVYAGSAMPLLLLFVSTKHPTATLLNYEPVAEEIVRTLVGSIGLVIAVPITTLIAAYWYRKQR